MKSLTSIDQQLINLIEGRKNLRIHWQPNRGIYGAELADSRQAMAWIHWQPKLETVHVYCTGEFKRLIPELKSFALSCPPDSQTGLPRFKFALSDIHKVLDILEAA